MSNVNKPVIPAEVADLIENMHKAGITNQEMTRIAQGSTVVPVYHDILSSIPYDTLLAALVNGYERELTEADKHSELKRAYLSGRDGGNWYVEGYADGIKHALDTLGVKIEGVNA
ncbi:hypothetical protein [Paenibacillus xylanexedens]|uniref:hypothetical protein n=1 Tax=Paenibacillus xylanexedens TaxID=528191 RepID=UPI00119FCDE1|nr:hypothetical protein [Paenibacillus xylanexedens]